MSQNEKLGAMIDRLAEKLPSGWIVEINVERGAGWAVAFTPDGKKLNCSDNDFGLLESLEHYLEQATGASLDAGPCPEKEGK